MNTIPINPLLSPEGNLISLEMLRGTLLAAPVPLDAGTVMGSSSVAKQQISVSVAQQLGLGSIFGFSTKVNETVFWMDAMQFADSPCKPSPDNIVSQTRWGYGLRILCRAQSLDASFNLNFDVLGAAVDLGLASVNYEVQTYGLGPAALPAILGGLSLFGALDGRTFHDLNTTVVQNLNKLIEKPPAPLTPRPVAVQLRIPVVMDPVIKARSEVFAMRRLREDMPLTDALAKAAGKFDTAAIRTVYSRVAPGVLENAKPGKEAKAFAKAWMG